jgi:glyoxylase-like metal-dependent hydrolase (beta-lactamase superfamily II)
MFKKFIATSSLIALLACGAFAQDAKTVIDNATKAMGSLKSVEYSGSGFDFAIGQNVNPTQPWPKFIDKTYKRTMNFETPAFRMERIRMQGENPPRGGGQQPIAGEQTQNQTTVVSANTPWVQQLEIWMMPHGFLQAAAKNNATLSTKTVGGKTFNVLTFTGQNKAKVNGYINDQNMVERVETWIDNAMLGDMLFDSTYSGYKDFAGVKFPTKIVQKQGDYPILDLTITDVKPNVAVNIQPPAAGAGGGGGAQQATSEKLSDGVYLILGGYAAIAVDFKDYIVVIEGPQSEERASAIIAKAKELIPGKPIKYVVNTHAHYDHSSGLRTFMAEGATVITHEVNKPFLQKVGTMPHTLNPDKLEQAKKKPSIETMTEKKVLTDGNHVIELYHVTGIGHHDGLLVAYLPKEKVLLEADAYNPQPANATPPSPPSPYTLALVANIERLKLDVNRIIPVHYPADNRVVTRAELMHWIGKANGN